MGLSTALVGLLPGTATIGRPRPILLVLLRLLQGLAVGGEWSGSVLLSMEWGDQKRRGLMASLPQLGVAFGLILGTGFLYLLSWRLTDDQFQSWGWRIPFIFSLVMVGDRSLHPDADPGDPDVRQAAAEEADQPAAHVGRDPGSLEADPAQRVRAPVGAGAVLRDHVVHAGLPDRGPGLLQDVRARRDPVGGGARAGRRTALRAPVRLRRPEEDLHDRGGPHRRVRLRAVRGDGQRHRGRRLPRRLPGADPARRCSTGRRPR